MPLVQSSETVNSQLVFNWFQIGIYQTNFELLLFQELQPLYDEIEKFGIIQGVTLEHDDSLKSNGTDCLPIFDVSCEGVCISKLLCILLPEGYIRDLAQPT